MNWLVDTQCEECGRYDSMTVVDGNAETDCMVDAKCPECGAVFAVDIRDPHEAAAVGAEGTEGS